MIPLPGTDCRLHRRVAALLLLCLVLAACAQPAPATIRWTKSGVDDAKIAAELRSCRDQANAVLANQQAINQDITATLGGNWQRSSTLGIESQSLNRSAAGLAQQTLENCMLAKGFAKS